MGYLTTMTFAPFVVYAGFYLFLVFFAVCLATGLYYVAELVEEYTRVTRRVISYTIKIVIGIHVVLLVWDRLPFLCIAFGVAAHVFYHRMLKTFPYISLTSSDFIASVSLLAISHIAWFHFFLRDPRCAYVSIEWVLGFMLVTLWIVPFAFFISLAANESVLPGAGSTYQGYVRSDVDPTPTRGGRRTRGTLLNCLNFLRKKKDQVLPQVALRIPNQYRGRQND